MTSTQTITGLCLCGAVTVRADVDTPNLRACHCDMCRRHTSGMFISVATVAGSVVVSGPAKSFRSSDWAERGFCERCGSTLWYGTVADGIRHPAAGLFDDAAGGEMKIEFFADECPHGYGLAGDHRKLTTDETVALFTGDKE
ncbi:MAG: GFA family protein [Roseovarius sp.]